MRGSFLGAGLLGLGLWASSWGLALGDSFPPMEGRKNLALGKAVTFSPQPNYALTSKGETDASDLTDGKTVTRKDQAIWFDSSSVGWSYPGRVNLAVDLGQDCKIDEVAIRLQNGSPAGSGLHFPGWVEAFISNDGEHYEKVAEFSRWNPGEFEKFGIGQERGHSYVDCLRFQDLQARGRFVGLRLYGSALMVSDELYVFGEPADADADAKVTSSPEAKASDFTVTHPQVYFHKPYLELATNVTLPVPLGVVLPKDGPNDAKVTLTLDLPPGLELVGGNVGKTEVASIKGQSEDQDGWTQLVFPDNDATIGKSPGRGKNLAWLYLRAGGWKDGQEGELRYSFENDKWSSGPLSIPVRALEVPPAPRLKRIMTSLGWWDATRMGWPDQLEAFRTLGLNTFNVFSYWMPKDRENRRWAMLEEAREEGFFISSIRSPLHRILDRHKNEPEIYDQFADGSTSDRLCLSYRGPYYQGEIQRFAEEMAAVRPHFNSVDIELWTWTGPTDSKDCVRCQDAFKKSGLESWEDWQKAQGQQMISDLMTSAQEAVEQAGGQPFETGGYDFRPGKTYQAVFNLDSLYPELLQSSQVSTYTSLQPADIVFIGDEARQDRSRLPKSDVMPWNTPGDAGTFPGEAFQWSLLENYCNGARGIWFWSSRVWDSENLIAYNKVIRAIATVEDVIVDGDLVGSDAEVVGPGRVSGMKQGNRMVLLVADYFGETEGSITLRLNLSGESTLRDLLDGQDLDKGQLPGGQEMVTIPLQGQRARLLEVSPR